MNRDAAGDPARRVAAELATWNEQPGRRRLYGTADITLVVADILLRWAIRASGGAVSAGCPVS